MKTYRSKAQVQPTALVGDKEVLITLPWLPPSLNEWSRQHWATRHRQVTALAMELAAIKVAYRVPRFERVRVRIIYYFRDSRPRDADNYAPKFLLDGLRQAGIIADDNHKVLQLETPEFRVDAKMPRTEVVISEL